jgi:hypothetical protein
MDFNIDPLLLVTNNTIEQCHYMLIDVTIADGAFNTQHSFM